MLPSGVDRVLSSFGVLLRSTHLHPFTGWTPNPPRHNGATTTQTWSNRYPARKRTAGESTQRGALAPCQVGGPQADRNLSIAIRYSWHCRKATIPDHASQGNQYVTNKVRFSIRYGFVNQIGLPRLCFSGALRSLPAIKPENAYIKISTLMRVRPVILESWSPTGCAEIK